MTTEMTMPGQNQKGETTMFYVKTNCTMEYFATKEAALLYIELHCNRLVRNAYQLISTNAIQ